MHLNVLQVQDDKRQEVAAKEKLMKELMKEHSSALVHAFYCFRFRMISGRRWRQRRS
jgi:hypothetical protein